MDDVIEDGRPGWMRLSVILLLLAVGLTLIGPLGSHRARAKDWPVKIFSLGTPTSRMADALSIRTVSGISIRLGWRGIQPGPRTLRWDPIDEAIAKARRHGKKVMVRVIAGIFSPDWVMRRVKTLTFEDDFLYNPANYPDEVTMPVPWGRKYLRTWRRFIERFGRRYDDNRTIYSVQMAGGGFTGEMSLPTDVAKWRRAEYTDNKYIRCWKRTITGFRMAFPHRPINLDITEPFGSLMDTNVVRPVVRFAVRDGAKKAYIQNNGLRASMLGTIGPYRETIRRASRVTKVGYQMIAPTTSSSLLRQAFEVAIQDHAGYVEVYAADALDPHNRTALRYLASDGDP